MGERPIPLFDQECELKAWWIGDFMWTHDDMRYLCFVSGGHAFRSDDNRWMGPVANGLVLDTKGRVVLWSPDVNVSGASHVYRPARPSRPPRPEIPPRPNPPYRPGKPPRPSGGWSPHSFKEWVRFKDAGPEVDQDRGIGEDYGMISFDE